MIGKLVKFKNSVYIVTGIRQNYSETILDIKSLASGNINSTNKKGAKIIEPTEYLVGTAGYVIVAENLRVFIPYGKELDVDTVSSDVVEGWTTFHIGSTV